jgi:hypothetical protein
MLPREALADALGRAAQHGDWAELFVERRHCCSPYLAINDDRRP